MARISVVQPWTPFCLSTEDGGMAKIYHIDADDGRPNGPFFRFQSWDEEKVHHEFEQFVGRRIRITIETVED